jgi:hypothetical protein
VAFNGGFAINKVCRKRSAISGLPYALVFCSVALYSADLYVYHT